jgi:hypothetical protein
MIQLIQYLQGSKRGTFCANCLATGFRPVFAFSALLAFCVPVTLLVESVSGHGEQCFAFQQSKTAEGSCICIVYTYIYIYYILNFHNVFIYCMFIVA